jgi:RNA polymerase sigma-70 factor (ECF subfamily)
LQQNDAFQDAAESTTALAELIREQRLSLRRFLLALVRNQADADDVLQEVFLKLLENWPSIRLETAKSWLFTVAYREALAHRRRRIRQDAALAELWARPVWISQTLPSAESLAVRREEIESVRNSLAALPEPQREVVERRIYRDQTFATIAADLGCPLGTVLTRMRRALRALNNLLEE